MLLIKNWIEDKQIGAIVSTSQLAVKRVCRKIDFTKRFSLVEYGAGTGAFSKYLLKRMRSDCSLILIERNKTFYEYLKQIQDPRVILVHDSAENILPILESYGIKQADYIISGIPFSMLDSKRKRRLLRVTHQALKDGGKVLVYQGFHHLQKQLKPYFRDVRVEYELRNFPPLFIYEAIK